MFIISGNILWRYDSNRCHLMTFAGKLRFVGSQKVMVSERDGGTSVGQRKYGDDTESSVYGSHQHASPKMCGADTAYGPTLYGHSSREGYK